MSKHKGYKLENIFDIWFGMAPKDIDQGVSIYHWNAAIDRAKQPFTVGYECAQHIANKTLPAGQYLCSYVILDSGTAYAAAWDALYSRLLEMDLEPDDDADVLEVMKDLSDYESRNLHVGLYLPVKCHK